MKQKIAIICGEIRALKKYSATKGTIRKTNRKGKHQQLKRSSDNSSRITNRSSREEGKKYPRCCTSKNPNSCLQ
uniref:Uncharacterized protein n=1 Tax=Onchocerca volvulus TaxID=6282 RepID=A0A8R1TQU7_ONCVO